MGDGPGGSAHPSHHHKVAHANCHEGCTTYAMDCAAAGGHLAVVQWVHANCTEGCTEWALIWAEEQGHLDMVWWLRENRAETRL